VLPIVFAVIEISLDLEAMVLLGVVAPLLLDFLGTGSREPGTGSREAKTGNFEIRRAGASTIGCSNWASGWDRGSTAASI